MNLMKMRFGKRVWLQEVSTTTYTSFCNLIMAVPVEFVNTSAATIAAQKKKDAANKKRCECEKRKRDKRKAAAQAAKVKTKTLFDDDSDDSIGDNGAKRQKQEVVKQKVPVYIHIHVQSLAPAAHQASSLRSKGKVDTAPIVIRGPFFFQLDQSYNDFNGIIMKELLCKLQLLSTAYVTWKYKKPANDPKKPLSSAIGYEAMVMSLKERKSNHVIVVSMPPPKADDAVSCCESIDVSVIHLFGQTWDTGDGDYVAKPYDHYEEVALVSQPDLSVKAQIVRILCILTSLLLNPHPVIRL